MSWWLIVVFALAALAVLGWAHHAYWTWRYRVVTEYRELHRIETPDGSAFELRRLGAPATPELPPVILVHGLATSHRNHDLDPDFSLARYLEAQGRDVWLLTLRSGREDLRRAERRRVRFEAMVRWDIPMAVDQVLERTRAAAVDYVGFSMGGMLLYSAIDRTVPAKLFRRIAIVGSPGRVELPMRWLRVFRKVPRWVVPALWLGIGARMYAFMADWFPTPIHTVIYNPRNVDRGKAPLAMVNAIADIPGELHADFAQWALGDGVIRIDGEPVLDRLEGVRVPAIFFAGGADRIAPAAAVRAAHDRWGSETEEPVEKELRFLESYGHGDMVIGRDVRRDIFVPLGEFLGRA